MVPHDHRGLFCDRQLHEISSHLFHGAHRGLSAMSLEPWTRSRIRNQFRKRLHALELRTHVRSHMWHTTHQPETQLMCSTCATLVSFSHHFGVACLHGGVSHSHLKVFLEVTQCSAENELHVFTSFQTMKASENHLDHGTLFLITKKSSATHDPVISLVTAAHPVGSPPHCCLPMTSASLSTFFVNLSMWPVMVVSSSCSTLLSILLLISKCFQACLLSRTSETNCAPFTPSK